MRSLPTILVLLERELFGLSYDADKSFFGLFFIILQAFKVEFSLNSSSLAAILGHMTLKLGQRLKFNHHNFEG